MIRILKWTGIIFGGLFVLVMLAGWTLYRTGMKRLDQPYENLEVETVKIPTDSDAVTRGRHIATIWICTRCHGKDLSGMVLANDPLSGMVPLAGTITASNLTSGNSGAATYYSEADWVRAIRHGVKPDGHIEVLMFNYSTMSDQDLGDLIAYLKQLPPIDTNHPELQYGPVIPVLSNIGFLIPAAEQIDHGAPHPADPTMDSTVEYGEYLSTICTACHITSIGNSVKKWNLDEFIRIFQSGLLSNGQQFGPTMSSDTFREFTDMELTAL